jgi:hypothetical protein
LAGHSRLTIFIEIGPTGLLPLLGAEGLTGDSQLRRRRLSLKPEILRSRYQSAGSTYVAA